MSHTGKSGFKYKRISGRYARAIFDLAYEEKRVNETLGELAAFEGATTSFPALGRVLEDREMAATKKHAIIEQIAKELGSSPIVRDLLKLLVDKDRAAIFTDIVFLFRKMAETIESITRVEAKVADPSFEAQFKEKLEKILAGVLKKKVLCEIGTDSSLIGGAIVKIGDISLDTSVAGRLNKMREELLSS